MLELLALVLAIIAVAGSRSLTRTVDALRQRMEQSERTVADLADELRRSRGAPPTATAAGLGPVAPPVVQPSEPRPPAIAHPPAAPASASIPVVVRSADTATAAGGIGSVPRVAPGAPGGPPPPPPVSGSRDAAPPPPLPVSLEEQLGTRWAVWVGGLALGLGGLLLVRYSIEQGFFGPGARTLLGLALALALVGAGEWFRRSERRLGLDMLPDAHIPGVLTAAGTASLFGTIYAAHALYGFIGQSTAFVALGLVGLATMLAAALHGPALAGLGLAGSYVAPMLVSSARPNPWPLVLYLAVVAAAAMGLARWRRWLWLAATAVGGAVVWGLILGERIGTTYPDWTTAGYVHCVLQLLLAAAFLAIDPSLGTRDEEARTEPVGSIALAALGLLAVVMLAAGRMELASAVPFALVVAFILVTVAWRSAPNALAACTAGVVVLAMAAVWPGLRAPPPQSLMVPELAAIFRLPEQVTGFLTFALLASLGVTAAALHRLHVGPRLTAHLAAVYALAAVLTPLLALILAWLRVKQFDQSIPFALAGAVLATGLAAIAGHFQSRETAEWPGTRLVTGALAAGAIAAFAFALVALLERGYLTVALALTALGTAWIAADRDIPLLRHVVTALAVVVLGRIAWDPRIMGAGVGTWPLLNWLLVGYGVPAACFWGAARWMERRGADLPQRLADAVAVLLAGLLAFFQIHHALNGGDLYAPVTGHIEAGLFALVSLGMSHALMRLDLGRRNPVFHWASIAFGALSALLIGLGLGLFANPLFLSDDLVRGPTLLSSLGLAYLLPGLAAVLLARASRGIRPGWYVTTIGALAALLVFGWATLEVRHAFQGERIAIWRATEQAEVWAYSAAWLALGIVFLAYGIWRGSLEARIASAVLVILTVAKVFLLDLSGLTGLWRALSFIVLGAVLIGIGLAYQHLLFGRGRPTAPGPTPTAVAPEA